MSWSDQLLPVLTFGGVGVTRRSLHSLLKLATCDFSWIATRKGLGVYLSDHGVAWRVAGQVPVGALELTKVTRLGLCALLHRRDGTVAGQ